MYGYLLPSRKAKTASIFNMSLPEVKSFIEKVKSSTFSGSAKFSTIPQTFKVILLGLTIISVFALIYLAVNKNIFYVPYRRESNEALDLESVERKEKAKNVVPDVYGTYVS